MGTVKDPSGAVLASASVTVKDVEHGETSATTTNEDGEFVASPLPVGRYRVSVQQTGFKKAVSVPRESRRPITGRAAREGIPLQ